MFTEEDLAGAVRVGDLYVDRDVLGVIERLQNYDPNLRVQYLEKASSLGEPPWRIVERGKDGVDRVVFSVWQLDHSVFDRIVAIDTFKTDVIANLDKSNNAARKAEKQRGKDSLAEATEYSHAVLSSPKDTYSVVDPKSGDLLKFSSNGTVKRELRRNKKTD